MIAGQPLPDVIQQCCLAADKSLPKTPASASSESSWMNSERWNPPRGYGREGGFPEGTLRRRAPPCRGHDDRRAPSTEAPGRGGSARPECRSPEGTPRRLRPDVEPWNTEAAVDGAVW